MDKIRKRGTLEVGGTDAGAMFSQRNPATNKLEGFDAGLSQMLAKYIIGKPSTKLSLTSVDTRETMLQNGSVDAVFTSTPITPQRAQKVDFAGPYYESGDAILVKASNNTITKPADLNGKTVATESNSTAALDLKKFGPRPRRCCSRRTASAWPPSPRAAPTPMCSTRASCWATRSTTPT